MLKCTCNYCLVQNYYYYSIINIIINIIKYTYNYLYIYMKGDSSSYHVDRIKKKSAIPSFKMCCTNSFQ